MTFLATSDFWTDHREIMTIQLPTYYKTLQQIRGKYHVEDESFSLWRANKEIVPLSTQRGVRTYCTAHFYLREPRRYLTMVAAPALPPDTASSMPLGYVSGFYEDGYDEVELGRGQAWYYPADRLWVLWECYFTRQWRTHPLATDENMIALWRHLEAYLREVCPDATRIVTPFNDPIAPTPEEYQALLTTLGYSQTSDKVFGKPLTLREGDNPCPSTR